MAEPPSKPVAVKAKLKWYELDWLVPYRDLILVMGFVAFEVGVFLLPKVGTQIGLMTTGAGLIYAAWRVLQNN